ncbi:Light-sensor Protein kinase [Senna tora]|uniref:Light-sensor Protein kinase n=1 Tax=Senna tora TaxID=362788 RepID=A0A834TQZ3_9FABA|nr:Light-sensor Protein kinase [Senna tora]
MEQFRQLGEALGSVKAIMVFKEDIQINQRQCCLLFDVFTFAYDSIAEEIQQNLKFDEKSGKWRGLQQPLKEVLRIFKEGEAYVKQCLETKDFWAKAITLYHNRDCVELYIHNLLSCIPIVVEAIESAGETSGQDQDEMLRKRIINFSKYSREYRDMNLFQWKFGKQYLVSQDFCNRYDMVWKEDRWFIINKIHEKRKSGLSKQGTRLSDLLLKNLEGSELLEGRLLPSSTLLGMKGYQMRRRLGNGGQYKEIMWLGESFVIRQFSGNVQALEPEITSLLSLSHTNIVEFLCGFADEEKKECFLLTELMSKNLCTYIKEVYGPRKRISFTLPVAVDLMLQIARGMEYLHWKKIYHGELNPSSILVKPRGASTEGYLHAKISGFGLSSVKNLNQKAVSNQNGTLPFIRYAPEVLEEQEQTGSTENAKYTEKSDVYSFGMVCFELLTGKVPFDDNHHQGDKISRNIRAGERPLFPFNAPKYITNLIKKCWHTDPNQRPSFSSICRILRYIKRFLALNPDHSNELDPPVPPVDYCDVESTLLRKFPSWGSSDPSSISQIPFQMFSYRVIEKEYISLSSKENSDTGSEVSTCGDEHASATSGDEPLPSRIGRKSLVGSDRPSRNLSLPKKTDLRGIKQPVTTNRRLYRPPQASLRSRSQKLSSESHLMTINSRMRRASAGHFSD